MSLTKQIINKQLGNIVFEYFRPSLRGVLIDQEIFTRKGRNFTDTNSANLILGKILKERIDLDSDKFRKMAYEFDFYSILIMMKKDVDNEIFSCRLWNRKGIEKVLNNLYKKIDSNYRLAGRIKSLVQRLYLVSAWYNHNRYVKR